MASEQPRPQLVIQTAFLGDLLLTAPLFRKIKKNFPNSPLVLICRHGLGDLIKNLGLVDQVYEIKKGQARSYQKVQEELAHLHFENAFIPHQSFRTAWFARKLKIEKRIGYSNIFSFLFFQKWIPKNKKLPEAIRLLQLLQPFDSALDTEIQNYENTNKAYLLGQNGQVSAVPTWASMSCREQIIQQRPFWSRLAEKRGWTAFAHKKVVLLFPGSVWATKRWTREGYLELAKELLKKDYQVLLMGAPDEFALCESIEKEVPGVLNWCGETNLLETLHVIARSHFVVGNDSAAIHMASLTETPVLAFFGPTIPAMGFRPWSNQAFILEEENLSCRPCGPHGHQKCPIGTHVCMKNISAQRAMSVFGKISNVDGIFSHLAE